MSVFYFIALAVSMLLGHFIMPKVLVISYKKKLFDMPDKRKVHTMPVPRLGGITFFPIILISFLTVVSLRYTCMEYNHIFSLKWLFSIYSAFFVGLTSLYMIGFADDLISVSYRSKFVVQIFAASLFPISGLYINNMGGLFGIYEIPYFVGFILTVLAVVFVTNAINLIDGIDGLASGLSIIALMFYAMLCFNFSHFTYLYLAGAAIGIVLIFFFFNVFGRAEKKQKIFMGDTGSLSLGYIISFLMLHFLQNIPNFRPWDENISVVALSALFVPMFDVIRVVITRLRDHRPPFLPDKNHIHHKLMRTGLNKMSVMVILLCVSIFFIVVNSIMAPRLNVNYIALIDIAIWSLLNVVVNVFIRHHEHTHGSVLHLAYNVETKNDNSSDSEKTDDCETKETELNVTDETDKKESDNRKI